MLIDVNFVAFWGDMSHFIILKFRFCRLLQNLKTCAKHIKNDVYGLYSIKQ